MAKQKKEEEKAELMISIEQFTRTRDSRQLPAMKPQLLDMLHDPFEAFVNVPEVNIEPRQVVVALTSLQNGLQHVQSGINDLLRAYMNHTSSILAGESGALDSLQLNMASASTAGEVASGNAAPTPAAATAGVDGSKRKRKREKKERDPNAPKRPLTAAFLYGQHARPIVRADLERGLQEGQKLEPNAVNLEVTRRWNEMDEAEKELWKASYRRSMEEYKEAMKDYTAVTGVSAAALHDDEEASDEAEAGALDTDAEASEESEDESAIAAKAPSPVKKLPTPPAAKTPRPNKRQKTATTNGISAPVPLAPAPPNHSSGTGASHVPIPLPSAMKATAILPPGVTPVEAPTPAKGGSKKEKAKKKDAPAPAEAKADAKEPSPEEGKKKKNNRSTRQADETPAIAAEKETPAPKKRDRKRKSEGVA